jgi:hypothetical protein
MHPFLPVANGGFLASEKGLAMPFHRISQSRLLQCPPSVSRAPMAPVVTGSRQVASNDRPSLSRPRPF